MKLESKYELHIIHLIGHRLFPHVTRACQGVIFKNIQIVKELMEETETRKGLKTTISTYFSRTGTAWQAPWMILAFKIIFLCVTYKESKMKKNISIKQIFILLTLLIFTVTADISIAANKTFTNKLGMHFILIPAGKFVMGSPEDEQGRGWNETQHTVIISKSFYIQETEVTQGQWKALVEGNPSAFQECGDQCPVDTVSWNQCMQFISFLNKYERTKKYRLPTEAEWEYACRAGSKTAFSGGPITRKGCTPLDPILDPIAWYCGNTGYKNPPEALRPHPVKTKKPNAWGIYDMHGNVQEWCLDFCKWRNIWSFKGRTGVITSTYKNNIVDPLSKEGDRRVFRGGGWYQPPKYCRSANRSYYKPVAKRNSLGFRIVREQ